MNATALDGKTVAFLTAQEGVEEVELTEPWRAVELAGGRPRLIAPEPGEVQAFNHLDRGNTYPVNETLDEADPDSYDALVLPGGVANPDELRTDRRALKFVQGIFFDRQAGRRDLPRAVDARRGRPRARQAADVVAVPADRHPQRRWRVGRRGGRRRPGPRVEQKAGRPAGLLRQDHRGVRRGTSPGRGRGLICGSGGRTTTACSELATRGRLVGPRVVRPGPTSGAVVDDRLVGTAGLVAQARAGRQFASAR